MGKGRAGRRAAAALVVVGLAVAGWTIVNSSVFAVRTIRVLGNVNLTAEDVSTLAGLDEGQNILRLSPADIERSLLRSPWIAQASVGRELPSTLLVTIMERTPVAMTEDPGGVVMVAADGTVLGPAAGDPNAGPAGAGGRLPFLPRSDAVLAPGDAYPEREGLLSVARSLPTRLRLVVARIRMGEGGIVLVLTDGGTVIYGTPGAPGAKNAALLSVLREVRRRRIAIDYIDVRIPSAPTVKPASNPVSRG